MKVREKHTEIRERKWKRRNRKRERERNLAKIIAS